LDPGPGHGHSNISFEVFIMRHGTRYIQPTLNGSDINSIAEKYNLSTKEFDVTECLDCAGIDIELVKGRVEVHRVTSVSQRDTGLTGGRGRSRSIKSKGLDL
jgi:hypothetical protein